MRIKAFPDPSRPCDLPPLHLQWQETFLATDPQDKQQVKEALKRGVQLQFVGVTNLLDWIAVLDRLDDLLSSPATEGEGRELLLLSLDFTAALLANSYTKETFNSTEASHRTNDTFPPLIPSPLLLSSDSI